MTPRFSKADTDPVWRVPFPVAVIAAIAVAFAILGDGTSVAGQWHRVSCPAKQPSSNQLRQVARPGSKTLMVPGHVTGVLVCRYSGVNSGSPSQLTSSGTAGLQAARTLQRRLNEAKQAKDGAYPCPMYDGRGYFVSFHYADGKPQRIQVDSSGCQFATNGKRIVFTTPKIQNQLAAISRS